MTDDGMPPFDDRDPGAADSATPRRKIELVAFDDIVLSTVRRYLVKGLVPRVGLTIVYGAPKTGKSFWTFDLAMHVALDWEYRGRRVDPGTVVYCAFEGQFGIEARAEAFKQRFLAEDREPVPFYLEMLRLDLVRDHKALIAAIRDRLQSRHPGCVVLDTLNRSLAGSESSDEDMGAYIAAADAIREAFACAVIIVHHSGLDATRPRGHTSLLGAADAQLSVKRDSADNIVVTVEYMKDGAQGDTIISRLESLEVGIDVDGDAITSCVILPAAGSGNAAPKGRKLSPAASIALAALHEAIAEVGKSAPGSNHIPASVTVVTMEQWRTYAYARGISPSVEPRARQVAFRRGTDVLVAGGHVGVWESFVWAIR